jgi:phage-related protein
VPDDEVAFKPVRWIGSSRDDVRAFPDAVRLRVGGALWEAQLGRKASWAKPLRGFGGASVLEVVDDSMATRFEPSTLCASLARSM